MTPTRSVLILGGGVAGMAAARVLSGSGLKVHLVEREARLGGNARQWACMAMDECRNCGACLSAELVDQTQLLEKVTIYTRTRLSQLTRTGNGFSALLNGAHALSLEINAVLLATGFEPFDPTEFQSLGYGRHKGVITTAELNLALQKGRPSDLLPARSNQPDGAGPAVAFVQCVGSRNREIGRDYCSQVCCKTALRQAAKLLHIYPGADISLFHMDLQIIGKEIRTQTAETVKRIRLLQGVPAEVLTGYQKEKLTVIREDFETNARAAHHFDLIVLAVGMGPAKGAAELMKMLKLPCDEWGFAQQNDREMPKGIYVAGAVQAPMDILSAQVQGETAANRIIRDLGSAAARRRIAVLADGAEGRQAAEALAADNFEVMLIDRGENSSSSSAGIQIFSNAALKGMQGTLGDFQIDIEEKGGSRTIAAEAIVVACGVDKRLPTRLLGLQQGELITGLTDFEKKAAEEITAMPAKILFWLDHFGPEWKDNCRRVMRLAQELAAQKKSVTVLMEKMLVNGRFGQRDYDRLRGQGVKFLRLAKGSTPVLKQNGAGLVITLKEATLPGVELEIFCDCLVVPEKVEPRPTFSQISQTLAIACDQEGFLQPANVRHRPVGSPRKGIFFVGGCHDEVDATDLSSEVKAIRAALDQPEKASAETDTFPQIKEGHCVRCLTCLRGCPHGAIVLKGFRQPVIVPSACFNCGLCAANCPAEAIVPVQVLPDQPCAPPQPETVVFACRRSGALAASRACEMGLCSPENINVITVNCAGRLNTEALLAPLVNGSRRVLIAACHPGNCRSMVGPESAAAKVERISTEINLPAAMLSYRSVAANEPAVFAAMITNAGSGGKEIEHD